MKQAAESVTSGVGSDQPVLGLYGREDRPLFVLRDDATQEELIDHTMVMLQDAACGLRALSFIKDSELPMEFGHVLRSLARDLESADAAMQRVSAVKS